MKRIFKILTILTVGSLVGCSSQSPDAADTQDGTVTLTVFAAASLQKSFDEIAEAYNDENPDVTLEFNYAGSSTLVQNIQDGAPVDIFASADQANMDIAQDDALIQSDTRVDFATNKLVGIVSSDNPAEVSNLQEANAADVQFVICAPQVPCGALSQSLADTAGITLDPVSEENQVTDVLGKVRSGQADAGLVYATDAALAPDEVEVFAIDGANDQLNHYPIARTISSEHPQAADHFIDYVQSEPGQAILQDNGFTEP